MKKITLLALMLCISSFAFAQFPAPYCGPLNFITDIEPITLVSIAEINNATDAAVDGSPSHEDFTALTANLTLGETYEITFEGNTAGPYDNSYTVFIDFNQNDILDDAGEVFGFEDVITNSTGTDGQSYTGSIAIPADALEGDTRMRVKKIYNSTNYLDPCVEGSGYGQAEDYTVSLSAPIDPTELPITFENQLPAFNDFNGSFTQAIPNPDATGENTSATVAQNNVPANTGDAGVNFALDTNIDISVDKGFTMNVWSPVANMPVLLKLENASGANAEIAATTTTTSAWETITFDFSEVGQLTYEAVTIFMNFQGFDAADQIYYWDNLEQIAIEADCNPVTGITISDITETSAVVSWEAQATALDGYAVGVFLPGSDPSVDEPVYGQLIPPTGILTDTATGLSSNTMYEAFVVSLCDFGGDIDIVAFSEAIPFTTLALGLADTTIEGFTFYPNPSLDVINLNATENIETVAIYNLLGQKVLDQIINATSSQLDVANLETGAYFMEVSAGAKTAWHKVIKK